MDKRVDAEMAIGKWLSAAMEDSNVCGEMKADIVEWFTYLDSRDALETKLRELIQEWREMSAEKALFQDVNEAYVIDVCADQLEGLIGEKDDG